MKGKEASNQQTTSIFSKLGKIQTREIREQTKSRTRVVRTVTKGMVSQEMIHRALLHHECVFESPLYRWWCDWEQVCMIRRLVTVKVTICT